MTYTFSTMAAIPWELLASKLDGELESRPLAVEVPVVRQLRTSYSPPPSAAPPLRWPLRALVIGDPATPEHALPRANAEAFTVARILREMGLEVELLVGPPSARGGAAEPAEPAPAAGP